MNRGQSKLNLPVPEGSLAAWKSLFVGCAPSCSGLVSALPCALLKPCPFVPRLIPAHPALVNAIVLVLHSVAGSTPLPAPDTSSRAMALGSYRDMPGMPTWEGSSGLRPGCSAKNSTCFPIPAAVQHPFVPLSAAGGFLFEGLSDDEDDFHQVSSQFGWNTSFWGLICSCFLPAW